MTDAEAILNRFEVAALRAVDWEAGIGHQPVQLFEHEKLKVGVQIEVKSAGVPGVSFMRYLIAHYRLNGMAMKRGPLLDAIELGRMPTTLAPPRGRPPGTRAVGVDPKGPPKRNWGPKSPVEG